MLIASRRRNPREPNEPPRIDPVTRHEIPVIPCLKGRPSCGPTRKRYHSAPRTRFQQKAREREEDVTDLQHITRVLKEDTTARCVRASRFSVQVRLTACGV